MRFLSCWGKFRATEIICYSSLFAEFGYRDLNFCGWQITPGLFDLVDVPDLQGLIAPRPLLVDIGSRDECFRLESAMECYRRVERIYQMAGAGANLELDLHSGGHTWGGTKRKRFFASIWGGLSCLRRNDQSCFHTITTNKFIIL